MSDTGPSPLDELAAMREGTVRLRDRATPPVKPIDQRDPFGLCAKPRPEALHEMPTLDAAEIAATAPLRDAPLGLKPCACVALPPLGTLGDEGLAAFEASGGPLPAAINANDVATAKAIETDIDRRFEAARDADINNSEAIATRRTIAG